MTLDLSVTWLQRGLAFATQHPHCGLWIAGGFSFLESLAIVGSVIPGSVTMTALGMLMGMGVLPVWEGVVVCTLGAWLGDWVSFLLGYRFKHHVEALAIRWNRPHWLARGKAFFRQHGAKSILIGRFIGPMRSMVPLVAGSLHMPPWRFAVVVVPTALLWAVVYLLPGMFLGAMSSQLPHPNSKTLATVVLALVLVSLLAWLYRRAVRHVNVRWEGFRAAQPPTTPRGIERCLVWLQGQPETQPLPQTIHQLTTALLATLFGCWLGSLLSAANPTLWWWDRWVYHSLQNHHAGWLNTSLLAMTFACSKYTWMPAVIAAAVFAWLAGARRFAACWLGYVGVVCLTLKAIKLSFFRVRPPIAAHYLGHTSFPSGHTGLTAGLVFFIAHALAHEAPEHRRRWYTLATLITCLGALSRIYLGAHWLSDVLAGAATGLALSCVTWWLYQRCFNDRVPSRTTWGLTAMCFMVAWMWSGLQVGQHHARMYFPAPNVIHLQAHDWSEQHQRLTVDLRSAFQNEAPAPTVVWVDTLPHISVQLSQRGWQLHPVPANLWQRLRYLNRYPSFDVLPLFTTRYDRRLPTLIASSPPTHHHQWVLTLWLSPYRILPHNVPVWVGRIALLHPLHRPSWSTHPPLTSTTSHQVFNT